jgi:hypothetical protein
LSRCPGEIVIELIGERDEMNNGQFVTVAEDCKPQPLQFRERDDGTVGDVLAAHKGEDDLSGVAALNDAAALIQGIGPGDALEGMLAAQMVTTHSTAMHCLQIASVPRQPESIVESNINRATKLMRVYTAQVEALNRHRSKGRQTMTVKHVHVHDGGQAIVGNVRGREGGVGEQP